MILQICENILFIYLCVYLISDLLNYLTVIKPNLILAIIRNRLTLSQCGKEGVVLYGLRSRDIKR